MKLNPKKFLIWGLLIFLAIYLLVPLFSLSQVTEEVPLSQALSDIKNGQVKKITIEDEKIILKYADKTVFSIKESNESMADLLQKAGINPSAVNLRIKNLSPGRVLSGLINVGIPILFTLGLFYLLSRLGFLLGFLYGLLDFSDFSFLLSSTCGTAE